VLLLCQLLLALGLLVPLLKPFQGYCQALKMLRSAADVADNSRGTVRNELLLRPGSTRLPTCLAALQDALQHTVL
jgi:hypothetical protein